MALGAYVQATELSPKYSFLWSFTYEIFRNTVRNVVLSTLWIANMGYVYVLFTFACLSPNVLRASKVLIKEKNLSSVVLRMLLLD